MVNRTQALRLFLDQRARFITIQRPSNLLRRQQNDVALRTERAFDQIRLQPGKQRRHEDDDRHTDPDADDDQQALRSTLAQKRVAAIHSKGSQGDIAIYA